MLHRSRGPGNWKSSRGTRPSGGELRSRARARPRSRFLGSFVGGCSSCGSGARGRRPRSWEASCFSWLEDRAARAAQAEACEAAEQLAAAEHALAVGSALAPAEAAPLRALESLDLRHGQRAKAAAVARQLRPDSRPVQATPAVARPPLILHAARGARAPSRWRARAVPRARYPRAPTATGVAQPDEARQGGREDSRSRRRARRSNQRGAARRCGNDDRDDGDDPAHARRGEAHRERREEPERLRPVFEPQIGRGGRAEARFAASKAVWSAAATRPRTARRARADGGRARVPRDRVGPGWLTWWPVPDSMPKVKVRRRRHPCHCRVIKWFAVISGSHTLRLGEARRRLRRAWICSCAPCSPGSASSSAEPRRPRTARPRWRSRRCSPRRQAGVRPPDAGPARGRTSSFRCRSASRASPQ